MLTKIIDLYRDREYFNNMTRIALPIIVQQLAFAALNMLGIVFVGQKGDTSVAAVGLAGQLAFLLNLVHFGIISGAAMFTAQFWGKLDRRRTVCRIGRFCIPPPCLFCVFVRDERGIYKMDFGYIYIVIVRASGSIIWQIKSADMVIPRSLDKR